MKDILTGLDDEMISTREMTYGVDSYDYVYERMIDSIFSNIDDIRKFYPSASVYLKLENRVTDSSYLRPDTIIIDGEKNDMYIIDAKNYRYGTTFDPRDLPETASIQKQVTYGEYIKKMQESTEFIPGNIYSAFVMPYSKTRNRYHDVLNKDIEYVATSYTKWYEDDGSKNRRILNLLIDMKYLVDHFNQKNNIENINKLITQIKENINR